MNKPNTKTQVVVLKTEKGITIAVKYDSDNPTQKQEEEVEKAIKQFYTDNGLTLLQRTEEHMNQIDFEKECFRRMNES
jgi:hypothetical protein